MIGLWYSWRWPLFGLKQKGLSRLVKADRSSTLHLVVIPSTSMTIGETWGIRAPGMGEKYKGRGFIQLTGRFNYQKHGESLGLGNQLVDNPDLANDPTIAAKLLASFLQDKERAIKEALLDNDLRAARKLVNGGSHGLDRFTDAFTIGDRLLPHSL